MPLTISSTRAIPNTVRGHPQQRDHAPERRPTFPTGAALRAMRQSEPCTVSRRPQATEEVLLARLLRLSRERNLSSECGRHRSRHVAVDVSAPRLIAGVLALAAAYVCGRAVGILLDINPYATEAAALGIVIAAFLWLAAYGDK
jgi:hypothetical protein